jgi:hypothetical protein
MHDVIGILEGHCPTHFVFIAYPAYLFRRSFFPTTWNHPFSPYVVRREYHVHRS